MTYQTITQFNASGVDGLMQYTASINPSFFPMVLFAIFVIVSLGTYFSQQRLSGRKDFLASATVASYFTTIIAFIFSLIDGVLNPLAISISFAFTVILTIILITSDK